MYLYKANFNSMYNNLYFYFLIILANNKYVKTEPLAVVQNWNYYIYISYTYRSTIHLIYTTFIIPNAIHVFKIYFLHITYKLLVF